MRTLAFFVLALPSPAFASGYYFSDSGVQASSRAGAWVASADDRFAQRYNPAGLLGVKRPTFDLGVSGVQQHVTFERSSDDGTVYEPATNNARPFVVPELGFATPVGDDFAFAFGLYTPYAPTQKYSETGAQRYSLISTDILQGFWGPSMAWRPVPHLSVGLGVQVGFLTVSESVKATTALTAGGLDDPGNDVRVDLKAADLFSPSFNVGLRYEATDNIAFGLAVQPPSHYECKGSTTLDFRGNNLASFLTPPEGSTEPVWTDDAITLSITLPLEMRVGVAVTPHENTEFELAAHWVQWSALNQIDIDNIDITIDTGFLGERPVPSPISLPTRFRDALTLSIGGESRVGDHTIVRAGAFWEQGALAPESLSVATVDPDKYQISGGGTAELGDHLSLDLGLSAILIPALNVTTSEVLQINALDAEGDALTVGNGRYRSSGWTMGLAARWAFGAPLSES